MKKLVLLLLVLLAPPLPAYADAIIEPENAFFLRHRDDMEFNSRNYYANGGDGWLPVVEEPGSDDVLWTVPNGEELHVLFLHTDGSGETWGTVGRDVSADELYKWEYGWVPMDGMALKHDEQNFRRDNELYRSSFDPSVWEAAGSVVAWTFPGSGEILTVWDAALVIKEIVPEGLWYYTDPEGRIWGCDSFLGGDRNAWICLDDPGSTTISAFNNPTAPALVPASAPENVPTGDAFPWLAVGLVTGVVALTAALIRILHRKPPKAGMEPEDAGSAPQESLERKNS